jgi:hypothetical protein
VKRKAKTGFPSIGLLGCVGFFLDVTPQGGAWLEPGQATAQVEQLRRMTPQDPVLRQSVSDADMPPGGAKFVEVVVAEVRNPEKNALVFEVRYEHGGASEMLGSFSLFPPDNPGRFLVATQGRVRPPGDIVLSVAKGESMGLDQDASVGVRLIRLISGR